MFTMFIEQRNKMKLIFRILFIILILFFCSNYTKIYSQSKITKENLNLQQKAHKFYKKGENDKALAHYTKIIKENYLNDIAFLQSYINYCEIMAQRKKYNEAVEKCELTISYIDDRIQELERKEEKKKNEIKEIEELRQKKAACKNCLDDYREKRLEQTKQKHRKQEELKRQNMYDEISSDYSEKDFVTELLGLPLGNNEDKRKEIKKIVAKECEKKRNNKSIELSSYSDMIALNTYWAKKVKYKQYDWLDGLTDKDSWYRSRIEEYNDFINKLDSINREKEIVDQEIAFFDKKIRIYEEKINNSKNIRDKTILNELKSKLYTMPQSMVIIGRKKLDGDFDEERDKLFEAMRNAAINEVSSLEILQRLSVDNENINSLYSVETKGIAQTTDKYYRTLTNYLAGESHIIELYRIEVFPFDAPKGEKYKDTNIEQTPNSFSNSSNIDIFIYTTNEDLERLSDKRKFALYDEKMFGFKKDEIDFIRELEKYSKEFNILYDEKIEKAVNLYYERYDEINNEIKQYEKTLYGLNLDKDEMKKRSSIKQGEIEQLKSGNIIKIKNECQKAKLDYENYYENKFHNVNNIAVRDLDVLKSSISDGFKKLADICFDNIIKGVEKQFNKTVVYKQVTDNNSTIILQEETIEYDLIIDSLRIISLNLYEISEKRYLALNLAFKIRWKSLAIDKPELTHDLVTIEIDKIPEHEQMQESKDVPNIYSFEEISEDEEPIIEKHPVEKPHVEKPISTKDIQPKSEIKFDWKVFDKMSLRFYNTDENKQNGWRLPTLDELDKFFNDPECRKKINNSLFNADNWKSQNNEIFTSSEIEYDNKTSREISKCYLIKDENYSREIINKNTGRKVWIILIRQ